MNIQDIVNLGQVSSERLAAQVVAYKTLGINKLLALICMQELARRRSLGEEFNFEDFIEVEINKIPKVKNSNLIQLVQKMIIKKRK